MKHHATAAELWVGYYKKGTGRRSIDWPESRDQALCFGWIDGIRKSVNDESFMIRFTPRRRNSIWSAVNTGRVKELKRLGLMAAAGIKAYEARDRTKTQRYSFEQGSVTLTASQVKEFRSNPPAWNFFKAQPASYRKTTSWWVRSGKKVETRKARLARLIGASARGIRL